MKTTNNKEQKASYYNKIFKKAKHYKCGFEKSEYYNVWFELIGFLPPDKSISITDVGCGTGQLLQMLEHYNYCNLMGFDFSDIALKEAIEKTQFASIYYGNIHNTRVISDVIICTEVLEHIENDCEVLEKFEAKQIIITVPEFNDPAHVRYFESVEDVRLRYGKYFKCFEIIKVQRWFILNGYK